MALNSSGPISLGGSTSGQSINLELNQSATAQISLNDANVRSLAGVSSGAITMPTNFWGKSTGPTVIGQAYGGGYYAGLISVTANNVPTHYLIIAPASSGQTTLAWRVDLGNPSVATSGIDGPGNSAALNSPTWPAAYFCEGLTIGGYTDWYLPARYELEICYRNFKPTSQANWLGQSNPYSVPPLVYPPGYTEFDPGQTGLADFQQGGSQAFTDNATWTSTNISSRSSYYQRFSDGRMAGPDKNIPYQVRAMRRIPV